MIQSVASARPGAKIFGFPIDGFGLLTSFLLALASGFFTFFAATFLAIFGLLVWNGILGSKTRIRPPGSLRSKLVWDAFQPVFRVTMLRQKVFPAPPPASSVGTLSGCRLGEAGIQRGR